MSADPRPEDIINNNNNINKSRSVSTFSDFLTPKKKNKITCQSVPDVTTGLYPQIFLMYTQHSRRHISVTMTVDHLLVNLHFVRWRLKKISFLKFYFEITGLFLLPSCAAHPVCVSAVDVN